MIYGTPIMMSPAKLDTVMTVLEPRLEGLVKFPPAQPSRSQYQVTDAGIAIIPVMGTLVRRSSAMSATCGMASYHGIAEMAEDAFTDPSVAGVLLDIDSCGGEAAGLFDLVAELRSMSASAGKPLWAHADESALSAAYGIACSADRIWIAQTAEAGSVGVVALHVDQSKADADAGLSYTYVYGGAHKTEGNPHEPLSDNARERLQADVDALYDKFCAMVADARKLPVEAVRNTEAGIYRGGDAVAIGLADYVGTLRQAHDAMAGFIHQNKAAPGRLFHAQEEAMNEEEMEKLRAEIEADAIARMTELNDIAAQAKRLGVDIDPAEAMRNGVTPDSFRKQVLEQAATLDRATDIVAAIAAPDAPKNDDRLLNAVKRLGGN
jgi:signal peptide peptidase SppA